MQNLIKKLIEYLVLEVNSYALIKHQVRIAQYIPYTHLVLVLCYCVNKPKDLARGFINTIQSGIHTLWAWNR